MIRLPSNDDYARWGLYRDGVPAGPRRFRYVPAPGALSNTAIVAYLIAAGVLAAKVWTAVASFSAVLAWLASLGACVLLFLAWPAIYTLVVVTACCGAIGYSVIMITRSILG